MTYQETIEKLEEGCGAYNNETGESCCDYYGLCEGCSEKIEGVKKGYELAQEEELNFLFKEIKHIKWARRNGMSDIIYDDFIGVFRRRIKELKGAESSPNTTEEGK